jgi:predicted RNase H-like HicB family nuclease
MKAKILTYRTIIKKDGKTYHGFVPSLSGCHTQGDSFDEVKKNLKEAIEVWIETRAHLGWSIPNEEGLESIEVIEVSKLSLPHGYIYA